jgi:hypothetical protein
MNAMDLVSEQTFARAAHVAERCNYSICGFVMEHRGGLNKRAIVQGEAVRWFPNDLDFTKMMGWQKHSAGPGIPAEGWPVDEMPALAPIQVAAPVMAGPKRPILTAPPTAKLVESAEEAIAQLAKKLGCHWNDMIPHNAGWFVPGTATAYASAFDAVQGLVERLRGKPDAMAVVDALASAMTHEHPMAEPNAPRAPKAKPVDTRQEALF